LQKEISEVGLEKTEVRLLQVQVSENFYITYVNL
jgi:hypothetical protein